MYFIKLLPLSSIRCESSCQNLVISFLLVWTVVREWFLSGINCINWLSFKISQTNRAYSTYTYSNHAIYIVEMIKSVFYFKFSTIIVIVCTKNWHNFSKICGNFPTPPPLKKKNQLRTCHAQMLINIFTNMVLKKSSLVQHLVFKHSWLNDYKRFQAMKWMKFWEQI